MQTTAGVTANTGKPAWGLVAARLGCPTHLGGVFIYGAGWFICIPPGVFICAISLAFLAQGPAVLAGEFASFKDRPLSPALWASFWTSLFGG